MITEDYVSFETAKLLKEKGFDELCPTFYETDEPDNGPRYSNKLGWFLHNSYDYSDRYGKMIISAPTLQMAMKWLREEHNLVVNPVGHYVNGKLEAWEVDIYFLDCGIDATMKAMEHIYGKTYESACENGIEYCLENLI